MTTPLARLTLTAILPAALPCFALTHYVDVNSTNPVAPYTNWATAANVIQDAVDAATNGDMVLVTNGVYATGGRPVGSSLLTNRVAITKPLIVQSVNGPTDTIIEGYQVPGTTNGDNAVRCAYLTNGVALIGLTLTHGATRAVSLSGEDSGGGAWCESTNAMLSNCVVVANAAHGFGGGVRSGTLNNCEVSFNRVLAYAVTHLYGGGGGAHVANLNDSSVIGNSAYYGGGAAGGILRRCVVSHNSGSSGGGVYWSFLDSSVVSSNSAESGGGFDGGAPSGPGGANCLFISNSASILGGGVKGNTWESCVFVGNSAATGGGMYASRLRNCITYFNSAASGPNYFIPYYGGSLDDSCTTPLPSTGIGNITNAPLFVHTNDWADLRLQSNSPCINAGNNSYVITTNDLDGNPRIRGGTVDMGAYEYQSPGSTISYAWLQQYSLPTDGSADDIDGDGDKATTWQEWKTWTNPTNEQSVLKLLNPVPGTNATAVSWLSVSNHTYTLERATTDAASFTLLQSNIIGQVGTTTFVDTTATNGDALFYRVSVPE